eukprot:6502751-Heterocapsa_arctica.AAC.1
MAGGGGHSSSGPTTWLRLASSLLAVLWASAWWPVLELCPIPTSSLPITSGSRMVPRCVAPSSEW